MKIYKKQDADTLTVFIEGHVDTVTSEQLQEELKSLTAKQIIFDVKKMAYISSAGLRVFLEALKTAQRKAQSIKIIHLKPLVKEIFHETGFDTIFDIGK